MAIVLDDFPDNIPKPPHQVRNSKYPWDQWLDGKVWGLKEGEDFEIKLRVFRQQSANHAKKHGFFLEMKSDLVGRILYIRAKKIETPPPPRKPAKRIQRKTKAPETTTRVVETLAPVDPVALVFGEKHERGLANQLPPAPRSIPGASFGERAGKEW